VPASATVLVPHGFICGFPTKGGDLYGGSMYIQSASSSMTPQGLAIAESNLIFGVDGSIPFSVCKYKYQPHNNDTGETCVACHKHEALRRVRYDKEGGGREYEIDVEAVFWDAKKGSEKEVKKEAVKKEIKKEEV
jgi:hypothetical protein